MASAAGSTNGQARHAMPVHIVSKDKIHCMGNPLSLIIEGSLSNNVSCVTEYDNRPCIKIDRSEGDLYISTLSFVFFFVVAFGLSLFFQYCLKH